MASAQSALLVFLLAGMGHLAGQTQFSIPSWLEPYPGASVETNATRDRATATYQTSASLADVIAHFNELFTAQGVPFNPQMYGSATVIQGQVPGCGITIQIRRMNGRTFVSVTANQRPIIPHITEQDVRQAMEKYDRPVYPSPKAPLPALTWPPWLTACDAVTLMVQSGVDRFKLRYLASEFDSAQERPEIQRFYSGLLNSNGYRVTMESSPVTPPGRPAVVEGVRSFGASGRFVIHINLTPTAGIVHVALRMTAHP